VDDKYLQKVHDLLDKKPVNKKDSNIDDESFSRELFEE
jgi:hypothetical protein